MTILKLTLKRSPFQLTASGEKVSEARCDSKWIRSRLLDSDGNLRDYDYIQYYHGHTFDSRLPNVLVKFHSIMWSSEPVVLGPYSNSASFKYPECWVISEILQAAIKLLFV